MAPGLGIGDEHSLKWEFILEVSLLAANGESPTTFCREQEKCGVACCFFWKNTREGWRREGIEGPRCPVCEAKGLEEFLFLLKLIKRLSGPMEERTNRR